MPCNSGGVWPGIPALVMPGEYPGPFGFGDDVTTSGGGYPPGTGPYGRSLLRCEHGNGFAAVGMPSAGGGYEHGEPGGTAGAGDFPRPPHPRPPRRRGPPRD